MKKLLVFASGSKDGGGSGFQELVENSRTRVLQADVVAVVSNIKGGGVERRAKNMGVEFVHMPAPWSIDQYQLLVEAFKPDLVALSGWLKLVKGLDPRTTINIHPGPLYKYGGAGMYGHHVHEAVIAAFHRGEETSSAVCMHFVTAEYDKGPVFFRYPVLIRDDDTPDTLAKRVNEVERAWQSHLTNLVLHGHIRWDGANPTSLVVPPGCNFL